MSRLKMPPFSPAGIIAAGLLTAQLFFTLFVYQSNRSLLDKLELISAAGYLPVPNAAVMSGLSGFRTAFCGGLFFTLTAGAALSLAAFFFICLLRQAGKIRALTLPLLIILWALGTFHFAAAGRSLLLTGAFVLIPAVTAGLALNSAQLGKTQSFGKTVLLHGLVILAIAAIWLPNLNSGIFINIRDQLLLTHPAGRAVNSFYYRYTLYPAESFKALQQKQLKTARIAVNDQQLAGRLDKTLRRFDYLPVPAPPRTDVDLRLSCRENELLLQQQDKTILRISPARFFRSPAAHLKTFSQKTDRLEHFRQFTYWSLITASPLLLYLLVYSLVFQGLRLLRCRCRPRLTAGLACLSLAAALAVCVYSLQKGPVDTPDTDEIHALLQSGRWQYRVRALKSILANDMDINGFQEAIIPLKQSRWTAERYWTARVLFESDSEKTYQVLIQLLQDPHPNVVCAALFSLGRRHEASAIEPIRRRLVSSRHWYIQLYAYNALKELGWTQPESDVNPF